VDIPTVSRWLGHKDGGALAMKTYGHLRNEHSQQMEQKVRFSNTNCPKFLFYPIIVSLYSRCGHRQKSEVSQISVFSRC